MAGLCEGRIVIVTGAGRGIGRGHALEFARQGAKVVVNDLGAAVDGSGESEGPAHDVVAEIKAMGGEAVANGDNVADFDGAKRLIDQAVETFGGLDVLVCNAGILRDRMLVNMTPEEWDDVILVHLRGSYAPSHHAANYWRDRAKAGDTNDARIICTSSGSGLIGNVGQSNYGAAKAGIAAFTVILAQELARYGVTANSISPGGQTRMTLSVPGSQEIEVDGDEWSPRSPENVAPIVVWLGSKESAHVTGQVFALSGGSLAIMEGWSRGPALEQNERFDPVTLGPIVDDLLAKATPPSYTARNRQRARQR